MNKTDRIKKHFSDNKQLYVGVGIGAGVVLAGITCVKMRTHTPLHSNGAGLPLHSNGSGQGFSFSAGRDMTNVGNVTHVNFGGRTHKLVRSNATGEIWESISEAAYHLGVDRTQLSRHLNGHVPDVNGQTYSIVGLGARSA